MNRPQKTKKYPIELFGEIYNTPNAIRRFEKKDYRCPFDTRLTDGLCKKNFSAGDERYGSRRGTVAKSGNCTLAKGDENHIICPHRFYEDNFRILDEVSRFVWNHPFIDTERYDELKLSKKTDDDEFAFGTLDWLLVHPDKKKFCGIEVQANNTTGTGGISDSILAMLNGAPDFYCKASTNTLDSIKKFVTQFIFKGQLFDDWKMPYVAIIQDTLWASLTEKFKIRSRRIEKYNDETFLFFTYKLVKQKGKYVLKKDQIRSGRWIDFLISYSVDTEILLTREDMYSLIAEKRKRPRRFTVKRE